VKLQRAGAEDAEGAEETRHTELPSLGEKAEVGIGSESGACEYCEY
jgi:hypothetical protein